MEYAQEKLFRPIGIGEKNPVMIAHTPTGNWFGAGGLWMTSKDLLKFGLLYLNKGRWGEKQIIPKEWVKQVIKLEN